MEFIETNISGVWLVSWDNETLVSEQYEAIYPIYYGPSFQSKGIKAYNREYAYSLKKGMLYGFVNIEDDQLHGVITGESYHVVMDIREESKTYGKKLQVMLSKKNQWMLCLPAGVAHGFLATSEKSLCIIKCRALQKHKRIINWDDPKWGVYWPFKERNIKKPILWESE